MIRLPGTSRAHRAGAALAVAGFLSAPPARALERIELGLPLLDAAFGVRVSELRDPRALLSGSSDLAELDQANNGAIGRRLVDLFQAPLPLHVRSFANVAVGSPLLDQALLLSYLGDGNEIKTCRSITHHGGIANCDLHCPSPHKSLYRL